MNGELIVAIFPSRVILTKALDYIMRLDDFDVVRAAIVAKNEDGKVVVLRDDLGGEEGGLAGGAFGAAVGALGVAQLGALALPGVGPVLAIGAGALFGGLVGGMTGRVAANLIDFGLHHEQIDSLTHHLEAGHPALVMEVEDGISALQRLREELRAFRAEAVERLNEAVSFA
jgi:uncharacterized membrane protein